MTKWGIFKVLAVVLTPVGAGVGYHFGNTEFRCVGLLQLKPAKMVLLYRDPQEPTAPEYFVMKVQGEVAKVGSARVLGQAVEDPQWDWKLSVPVGAAETLKNKLQVTSAGELIEVAVTDSDKTAAVTGVKTVISAYVKQYNEETAMVDEKRLELLQERRAEIRSELSGIRQQVFDIASAYGTDDLGALRQFSQDRINKMEQELQEAKAAGTTSGQPSLKAMSQERDALQSKLSVIGSDLQKLNLLRDDCARLQKDVDETESRIDQLRLESQIDDRLTVISNGDVWPDPYRDTHLRMAACGGAGGMAMALLVAVMIGSRNPVTDA